MRFDIDLEFSAELPAEAGKEAAAVNGTIKAAGQEINIHTDNTSLFRLGSRRNLAVIKELAQSLAKRGIVVNVSVPEGTIVSVGAVDVSPLQRLLTTSAHIKPGKSNTWATVVKAQTTGGLKGRLMPPSTPFPLVPTFQKSYRMKATTTHYARGGGRPRLIFVRDSETWDGRPPKEYNLTEDSTVIGSGADANFILPELAQKHGRVDHTDQDEYVYFDEHDTSINPGGRILRTGARLLLGPWRMVFFREEYADHGRPFGGRTGGEFSRMQRPQFDPRTGQIEYDAVSGLGDPRRQEYPDPS
ncbi:MULTISPECIES: FHA domain-containing protein [Arthrobacter]|uniref:FHA domain-containing protein n=1 Tax=unclassified Arthrobacter TaxID=235627 RepID=UPI0024BA7F60|nr:FHA domain-containing protein [Arthrobacter sp. H35-MC1]MDJ0318801.1 FHA domain-containing protein [Arthrobacter sp. H35-MC1]